MRIAILMIAAAVAISPALAKRGSPSVKTQCYDYQRIDPLDKNRCLPKNDTSASR